MIRIRGLIRSIIMLFIIGIHPLCHNNLYAGGADYLGQAYWSSGKAEFQTYSAKILKYGYVRESRVKIIIVKEPFDPVKRVKSLSVRHSLDVMKMNYIQIIPAGVYTYYQMASVFFNRTSGEIIKYTMSSQDGCGNSYMKYERKRDKHDFVFNSYFDDEGEIRRSFAVEDPLVFYDALPLYLRFHLKLNKNYRIKLLPGFISNKFTEPKVSDAEVSQSRLHPFSLNRIIYKDVFRVIINCRDKKDRLYFDGVYPYRLLKWEKNNGDILILNKSSFLNYWEKIKPGDAIGE